MKKYLALIFGLLFCALIFTSFSPSLDGRAVVASAGVMPQGVFARTVGYLPGDSISVTNMAKKTTVEVLVIGSLDPSEGIAILLSPEAAEVLGMDKSKNNIVKVTKRSGQLDETVSGTAIIGDVIDEDLPSDDGSKEELALADDNNENEVDNPVSDNDNTDEEEFVASITDNETEKVDSEDISEKIDIELTKVDEEPEEPKIDITEKIVATTEDSLYEKVDDSLDSTDEAKYVSSEKVDDDWNFEDVALEFYGENTEIGTDTEPNDVSNVDTEIAKVDDEKDKTDEQNDVSTKIFDEDLSDVYTASTEKVDDSFDETVSPTLYEEVDVDKELAYSPEGNAKEEAVNPDKMDDAGSLDESELIAADKIDDVVEEPGYPVDDSIVWVDDDGTDKGLEEKIIPSDKLEEIIEPVKVAETIIEPNNDIVTDKVTEDSPSEDFESYEAIVLVPAEPKAPENPDAEEVVSNSEKETIVLIPVDEDKELLAERERELAREKELEREKELAKERELARERELAKAAEMTKASNDAYNFDKYTVPSIKALEKGKYYIQIGVYNDKTNIKGLIDKYGENYPLTLVPLVSGKADQVMVGPLGVDEYGTVLNRFKNYGYKDAFLRKIR